jgi:hypothetical protein
MKIEDLMAPKGGADGENKKKESPLISLQEDLDFYSDSLKEVAVEIDVEGLSSYPIFVAHQHEMKIGELIIDREELGTQWTIHASTLEEFIEKGLIQKDKKALFESNYKDASQFMCVFVVVPEGANFVFYPYKQ